MKYFLVLLLIFMATIGYSETYTTWDVLELDTCISAWLIKRFIDKEAEFRFYPKGEFIKEGIPFDTPDAEMRRRHGMSTFESIIAKYQLTDPVIKEMAKIVHQIEINYWDVQGNTQELKETIDEIITASKDPQGCLEKSFPIFDQLYRDLKTQLNE